MTASSLGVEAACVHAQLHTVPAEVSLPAYRRAPITTHSVRLACLCKSFAAIRALSSQLQHMRGGRWVVR